MNKFIVLLIMLLTFVGCSKNPMSGGVGHIDDEHLPFLEVETTVLNNLPVINDNIFSIIQDEILNDFVTALDPENDPIQFSIILYPTNGTLSLNNNTGEFTYTPALGFVGIDFFSITAFDGKSTSSAKSIFINVLNRTHISGSLVIGSVNPERVVINFSQLQVDGDSDLNICLSEDSNENLLIDEIEYCNVAGSEISVSQIGDSSGWSDLVLESGYDGLNFNLNACNDRQVFAVAEIIGQNNTQIVTSNLNRKIGWTPACLNGVGIKVWLDAQDSDSFVTNFVTTTINATGVAGSNVFTVSKNPTLSTPIGSQIQVDTELFQVTGVTATTISVTPQIINSKTDQPIKILTIAQWKDKSNSNINAVQTDVTLQPHYTTKGINNLPSVLSNGDKRGLSVSGLTYNEFSIFMITRETSVSADVRSYIAKRSAVSADQFIFSYSLNGGRITWDQTGGASRMDTGFLASVNTSYMYNWTRKSGDQRYQYVNGSMNYSSSNNTDLTNSSRLDIGHENNAALRSLSGYIGEVIIFNQFIDPSIRVKVEAYLAWRWGLQNRLPTDHPYKNQNI